VSSNTETSDQIEENLLSTEKPKDGESPDPEQEAEEKVSKAASELGKKGGKAAAEKRATEAKEESKGEEKLGKPRDDPKARMLEATRKESEAKKALAEERRQRDEERAEWKRRLEAIEARVNGNSSGERRPEPRGEHDPEPQEKDFETYAEFVKAGARWAARQEYRETQRQRQVYEQAERYAREVENHVQNWHKRVTEALPDAVDRIHPALLGLTPSYLLDQNQQPGPGNWLANEIIASEHSHGIMLYLTENEDVLQRIATLRTPRDIAREVAKIESRLEAAPAGTGSRPEASKAKPPVRPVTGSPNAADPLDVDDETPFEEHVRRMNARDFQKKRQAFSR
jgi:hypothetical protein